MNDKSFDDKKGRRPMKKKFSKPRRKVCVFCAEHMDYVDFKDINRLGRFVADNGKILPRRATGVCTKHQRRVTVAVKRAREIALLPFVAR